MISARDTFYLNERHYEVVHVAGITREVQLPEASSRSIDNRSYTFDLVPVPQIQYTFGIDLSIAEVQGLEGEDTTPPAIGDKKILSIEGDASSSSKPYK